MKVRIGNLKIEEVLDKLGITLPEEVVERMEARYQPSAQSEDIEPEQWHCFEFPFCMSCGSRETAYEWFEILSPYGDEMKTQMQIVAK
ncbi:hypothetical protein [Staphylococcus simulans]|uniref:hypothetical protein n=1 Tax=Staphylococcus simulans TaxID=1286 RepID=UPI0021D343BA|nr:hypothetical protein [Staphylococcus simulans]UXR49102.1 hypothetical protein MUA28_08060 [Staphylococcus simulans]